MPETAQQYMARYGDPNQQISPEYAWQRSMGIMEGEKVMGGLRDGKGAGQWLAGKAGLGNANGIGIGGGGGGGAGGGSGLGGTYQGALDAYNAKQRDNTATINRGYASRQENMKDLFTKSSGGVIDEINKKWNRVRSEISGDYDSRGLFNAHQGDTKELKHQQKENLTQAEGEIIQKQALLDAQLSKDGLDFRERDAARDVAPNVNQMIDLEKNMGAGSMAGMPIGMPAPVRGGYQPPGSGWLTPEELQRLQGGGGGSSRRLPTQAIGLINKWKQDQLAKGATAPAANIVPTGPEAMNSMRAGALMEGVGFNNVPRDENGNMTVDAKPGEIYPPYAKPAMPKDPLLAYSGGLTHFDPILQKQRYRPYIPQPMSPDDVQDYQYKTRSGDWKEAVIEGQKTIPLHRLGRPLRKGDSVVRNGTGPLGDFVKYETIK